MSSLLAAPACVVDATGGMDPSTQEADASSIESTTAALTLDPTATQLVSFQSYNYPNHYIRYANSPTSGWGVLGELATIGGDETERLHATFRVVPGFTRQGAVSFESVNLPGYYLRHTSSRLLLQKNDGSDLFAKDASFYPRSGLAGTGMTSFEAVNFPGSYLRHYDYHLYLGANDGSGLFAADASFRVVDPLAAGQPSRASSAYPQSRPANGTAEDQIRNAAERCGAWWKFDGNLYYREELFSHAQGITRTQAMTNNMAITFIPFSEGTDNDLDTRKWGTVPSMAGWVDNQYGFSNGGYNETYNVGHWRSTWDDNYGYPGYHPSHVAVLPGINNAGGSLFSGTTSDHTWMFIAWEGKSGSTYSRFGRDTSQVDQWKVDQNGVRTFFGSIARQDGQPIQSVIVDRIGDYYWLIMSGGGSYEAHRAFYADAFDANGDFTYARFRLANRGSLGIGSGAQLLKTTDGKYWVLSFDADDSNGCPHRQTNRISGYEATAGDKFEIASTSSFTVPVRLTDVPLSRSSFFFCDSGHSPNFAAGGSVYVLPSGQVQILAVAHWAFWDDGQQRYELAVDQCFDDGYLWVGQNGRCSGGDFACTADKANSACGGDWNDDICKKSGEMYCMWEYQNNNCGGSRYCGMEQSGQHCNNNSSDDVCVCHQAGVGASPALANLALGRTATQSSTVLGADAARAIDNNTSGNWGDNSVTHTDTSGDTPQYWEVDLGSEKTVTNIFVHGRTDCCGDRLANHTITLYDGNHVQREVSSLQRAPSGSSPNEYAPLARSRIRYVRVSLTRPNVPLSLAEVKVWGY